MTLAPKEIPTNKLTIKPIKALLLPTAAMACLPTKRPITMTSAALKSCCKIPVQANGIANNNIFDANGPCNISISFFIQFPPFKTKKGKTIVLSDFLFKRILVR